MAVTQQLARVPLAQLIECRRSVDELDSVCSFDLDKQDYRDLNWWPSTLNATWALMGIGAGTLDLLRRSMDGDDEVNPAYREVPYSIFEHPVTALEPVAVAEVAAALRSIEPSAVRAAVPADRGQAVAALGELVREIIGDLPELIAEQHAILRCFYDEAARRGLATMMWWD